MNAFMAENVISPVSDANFAGFEIVEDFHRTGAVEACLPGRSALRRRQVWGRGTNRVITACEHHGVALPTFEERQGLFIVTFNATIAEAAEKTSKAPVTAPVTAPEPTQSPTQLGDPVQRLLSPLQKGELLSSQLHEASDVKHRLTFRQNYLHPALSAGFIEYTIPDKPNSRMQKYRLTSAGRAEIEDKVRNANDKR